MQGAVFLKETALVGICSLRQFLIRHNTLCSERFRNRRALGAIA